MWVMLLSTIFLRAKYRLIHFAGVGICLLGIGVLAYADIQNRKSLEGRMLLYVYIRMYVCYVSTCLCRYISVHLCVGMYIFMYVYMCMCVD